MKAGYGLVVIGASWGGLVALERLLEGLPADLDAAVAIAQHRSPGEGSVGLPAIRPIGPVWAGQARDLFSLFSLIFINKEPS